MVTLTVPDDGQRFYAPWRDDARPVSGLLQGAYAYLGLSRFWRQRQSSGSPGCRTTPGPVAAQKRATLYLKDVLVSYIGGGSKSKSSRSPAAAT